MFVLRTLIRGETSGGVVKCRLFSHGSVSPCQRKSRDCVLCMVYTSNGGATLFVGTRYHEKQEWLSWLRGGFKKRQYEENSFVRDFLRGFVCCLGLGRDVRLRSRRLEVICKKEHARGEGAPFREAHRNLSPCVSSSCAPIFLAPITSSACYGG